MRINKILCLIITLALVLYSSRHHIQIFYPIKIDDGNSLDKYRVKCCFWELQQSRLPNLTELQWPSEPVAAEPAGIIYGKRPPAFEPVMSRSQRSLSRKLLHIFAKTMFENGMGDQFMLYGGTLLGSYRHHDFIPWDDDVDVIVNLSLRHKVRALLKRLSPEFEIVPSGRLDKFHARIIDPSKRKLDLELSRPVKLWGWPFIDIFYFYTNEDYMVEFNDNAPPENFIPLDFIFPLFFRPFGKEWYPAPRDTYGYILLTYGSTVMCVRRSFSHVDETIQDSNVVRPCSEFTWRYAFVKQDSTSSEITFNTENGLQMKQITERLVLQRYGVTWKTIHELSTVVAHNPQWWM